MRRLVQLIVVGLLLGAPAPAVAQDQGGAPYGSAAYGEERVALFEALKSAESEAEGRAAEDAIWRMWFRGPTEEIGAQMSEAAQRLRWGEYDTATELFSAVVAAHPDYSEGYNQRAFAHFLAGRLEESLVDIDRTLALEPNHFGALSGRAQVFLRQGRIELALGAIREAVKIHPYLRDRTLLPEDERRPEGTDL